MVNSFIDFDGLSLASTWEF